MKKYLAAISILSVATFLLAFGAAAAGKKIAYRDDAACTKCLACVKVCPVKAISKVEKDGKVVQIVTDPKKCIACGKCIKACPVKAISWGQYDAKTGVVTPPAVKDTSKAAEVKKETTPGLK